MTAPSTIGSIIKEYGIRGLVLHKDWPTYEEEDAVPYTVEELKSLFAVADEEDFVRFQFFLKSGARGKEVIFATYPDLDFESSVFFDGGSQLAQGEELA